MRLRAGGAAATGQANDYQSRRFRDGKATRIFLDGLEHAREANEESFSSVCIAPGPAYAPLHGSGAGRPGSYNSLSKPRS